MRVKHVFVIKQDTGILVVEQDESYICLCIFSRGIDLAFFSRRIRDGARQCQIVFKQVFEPRAHKTSRQLVNCQRCRAEQPKRFCEMMLVCHYTPTLRRCPVRVSPSLLVLACSWTFWMYVAYLRVSWLSCCHQNRVEVCRRFNFSMMLIVYLLKSVACLALCSLV